ncbi:hypothetical protein Tco_1090323 [Tanacetum coccineum]|uniref:Reverse transcriptase domain-containing protein n=1 Tax=Tanacetum coccineum TaxID=301880 RepID=A0ABQ5I406_9ASTR
MRRTKIDLIKVKVLIRTEIKILTKGGLPSNTIPNPREEIKVITTRSGITLAGPQVPPPTPSSEEDEGVKQNLESTMDQVHISILENTIRVLSPIVQPSPGSKSSKLPSSLGSKSSDLPPSPASRSSELPK